MIAKVAKGEIRSVDKVRQHILENASPDVAQFVKDHNELRYLDESKFTLVLKCVEEMDADNDERLNKTLKLNKDNEDDDNNE